MLPKVGEDIKKGTVIAKASVRLNPYHIGLAAALGCFELNGFYNRNSGSWRTGNELADMEQNLAVAKFTIQTG